MVLINFSRSWFCDIWIYGRDSLFGRDSLSGRDPLSGRDLLWGAGTKREHPFTIVLGTRILRISKPPCKVLGRKIKTLPPDKICLMCQLIW